MSIQNHFEDFNDIIKMDYSVKSELKEKRNILLSIISNCDDIPTFSKYDQGSYAMYLGVEPLDKEYDIDVGLRFHVNSSEYNPLDLKERIYELLKNHTEYGAKIKKPCITVTYKKDGEAAYHVDLVVYAYENKDDKESQLYLAKGKDSSIDECCWEESDPVGLINYINEKYKGDDHKDDREQFRRIIRYLKRWKNLKFDSNGNSEPPSIGISLIAVDKFESYKKYDFLEGKYIYDDLNALLNFVKEIKRLFVFKKVSETGRDLYSISYDLPSTLAFENNTNIFRKMTDNHMTDFKDKIDFLIHNLEKVNLETDEIEQCTILGRSFGDDFPIPEKKDVSKKQMNYIPSSTASGKV